MVFGFGKPQVTTSVDPVQEMRSAIRQALGTTNNTANLEPIINNVLKTGYSEETFIRQVVEEMTRTLVAYTPNTPERQQVEASIWAWTRKLKVPDEYVVQVWKLVQDEYTQSQSFHTASVPSTPTPVQTNAQSPTKIYPTPVQPNGYGSSMVKATSTEIQPVNAVNSTSTPVDIPEIFLDRDGCSDSVLHIIGENIAKVYRIAGFQSIEYSSHGKKHLRVIPFKMKANLADYMKFGELSSDKMIRALEFLGIQYPIIRPGLHGHFEIQIPKPKKFWTNCEFKDLLPYNDKRKIVLASPAEPPRYNIGLHIDGRVAELCWEQPFAFSGMPRSGKSTFIQLLALVNLLRYKPEWVCMGLIDLRKKTMSIFDGLPHLWNGQVITNTDDAIHFLKAALKECSRRDDLFTKEGCLNNIWKYNTLMLSKRLPPLPIWMIMIDEIDTLKDGQHVSVIQEIDDLLEQIGRLASSNGILIGIGAHTASQKSITTNYRNDCPTRVILHSTRSSSRHIMDDQSKAGEIGFNLLGKGDAWMMYFGQEPIRTQLCYLEEDLLDKTVERLQAENVGKKPTVVKENSEDTESPDDKVEVPLPHTSAKLTSSSQLEVDNLLKTVNSEVGFKPKISSPATRSVSYS